jgi:peptidoglycan/LPS O-acetylase OafA/YrhL
LLALVGATRYGLVGYTVLALLGTFALAVPSWHLVERPALALKDVRFPFARPSRQRVVRANSESAMVSAELEAARR